MTDAECIALARLRLDDEREPYLWSDAVLQDALKAAIGEAADRARLIEDTEVLDLSAGEGTYPFTLPVLEVTRVQLGGTPAPLVQRTPEWLDRYRPGWQDQRGAPREYLLGEGTLTVVPAPETDGELTVTMARMAKTDEGVSVIPERYHRDLIHWLLFECYSLRDPDGENAPRTQQALQLFERRFGPRKSAVRDRVARELPSGATVAIRRMA